MQSKSDFMKIYFLGTNGWYDSATGNTPCVLIDAKEAYVILDAGTGLYKIDQHIKDKHKPIHVFLSHFHLDHIIGLHTLPKFKFKQGITIWGQPGTKDLLKTFINAPFTATIARLKVQVDIEELKEGVSNKPVYLEARALTHSDLCFGYRFELEGKLVAYCTDTGPCDNFDKLAHNTDLLITECAWKKKNQSPSWPHLSPYDAAEIAAKNRVKKLILTHFDAASYQTKEERKWAEREARKIFKNTQAAFDGMELEI